MRAAACRASPSSNGSIPRRMENADIAAPPTKTATRALRRVATAANIADMLLRIAGALAALCVVAFLALELRGETAYQDSRSLVFLGGTSPFPPGHENEIEETRDRLRDSARVRPGTEAKLLR